MEGLRGPRKGCTVGDPCEDQGSRVGEDDGGGKGKEKSLKENRDLAAKPGTADALVVVDVQNDFLPGGRLAGGSP